VFSESVVHRIMGHERVEAVEIERAGAIKPFQMAVQGVIVRIGFQPNTDLFRDQLEMDDRGYVIIRSQQETSLENVFAVGDVASPLSPTISSAVGGGATAAKVVGSRLQKR
jgi:thioredoxin reductase (NADPH)